MYARADTRPRHRNRGRPLEKDAPGFLQWIRGRNCICAGPQCSGKIEASHVDYAGGKGIGTKVADRFAVPMCGFHHGSQHEIGWIRFEAATQIDALRLANDLWAAWPGRPAWERKLAGDEWPKRRR